MKAIKCNVLTVALANVVILFIGLCNNALAQEEEILTGVVKAVQWHDDGDVIAAVLVVTTDDEDEEGKLTTYIDEYSILDDRIGQQLFKYDGESVEVEGKFLEDDDGVIFLKIISYRIIESEEELYEENSGEEDPNEEYPNEDELEEPPK
jgi:hypothetical protein